MASAQARVAQGLRTAGIALPPSFAEWRRRVERAGLTPVIAVGGSRGKTTVVRLLDAMFRAAGLRTALWTNRGVEVNGRRQAGELVPWTRALLRLTRGDLDVAVQELDWSTVHAVGLPPASYPIAAVTNLCVNSDSCLAQTETRRAFRALKTIRAAGAGPVVLNGEDFAVAGEADSPPETRILVGLSAEAPLLRAHVRDGGFAAWMDEGQLRFGSIDRSERVGQSDRLDFALGGTVGFQLHNALTAAAVARACGLAAGVIEEALADFAPDARDLPGSFNIIRFGGMTVVVDRPAPSWFLRPSLRAISHIPARRLVTVVGDLSRIPADDLGEVGRLLGRGGGALVLSDDGSAPERIRSLRGGIGSNDVPPLIVRRASERQAVAHALRLGQPGDLVLIIAENPLAVLRSLGRAAARSAAGRPS